jgi:precorrin-6Y C5,15-methyltransferase (decarboxylating)
MKKRLVPILNDDEFIRDKVPMTKASVRHLSVLKLGLSEGDVVYDIGSGTGSIACEIALQSDSLKVYAIEMKSEACELIKRNADKFELNNITVVEGKAPEAFDGLEAPDCAFIGGSSGNLKEILSTLSSKKPGIRVVINAVSLETMAEIQSVIKGFEISDLEIEQISVSRSRELGDHHLMMAENPVLIASFTLGAE